MSRFKLSRTQTLILGALAAVNALIIIVIGVALLSNMNSAPAQTPLPLANATDSTPLPPATLLPPPTWTPVPTPTPQGMDLLYTFTPGACAFEIPAGTRVDCGVIVVPETRGAELSSVVRLAVARYHSSSATPGEPLIYLTGGPGGSIVEDFAAHYRNFYYPLLTYRDIIVFDQRGAGLSRPYLECPEFHTVMEMDLQWNYPANRLATEYASATNRCRTRWEVRGVNLAAYTSAENAADVKDIITILGYERAILYGASYGSRLALTVMRDYPEVVRSAVLDGVVPLEVLLFNDQSARTDRLLRTLFADCAADPDCNASYPNLQATYESLIATLDAQPVDVWSKRIGYKSYRIKVNGDWITGAIFFGAYDSQLIPYFPMMLSDVSQGDYELLSWMLGNVGQKTDLSTGMYLSVNCHEEVFATTPEQMAADLAAYPHTQKFSYWSSYGAAQTLFSICEIWPAAPYNPRESEPVISDIPTLLLSGQYDPVTPPQYGQMVAANLANSQHYEFPGQGHGAGLQSLCALHIAQDFINDPYAPLDTSCIDTMTGPNFLRQR